MKIERIDGRSHRGTILATAILLALPAAGLLAQTSDTLRLTGAEAVARADAAAPHVLPETAALGLARAEAVNVDVIFPEFPEVGIARETDGPFGGHGDGSWEFSVTQEVDLSSRPSLRRMIADAGILRADNTLRTATARLRSEVRTGFADLAAAQQRLVLADTLAAIAERLDAAAGRLLAAGAIAEIDRNAVRIDRFNAMLRRQDAAAALVRTQAALAPLVDAPPGTVVIAADSFPTEQELERALADAERALGAADSIAVTHSEWRQLDADSAQADAERAYAWQRWAPNVTFGLSVRNDRMVIPHEDIVGSGAATGGIDHIENSGMLVGLRVGFRALMPFPTLYDAGTHGRAVAEANLAGIQQARTRLRRRIGDELRAAAEGVRTSVEVIRMYRSEIAPTIARNGVLLERGYGAGELDVTHVLAQKQQLAQAIEVSIAAAYGFRQACARLDYVLGR